MPIPFAALGAMILDELGLLPFFIYLGSLGLILLRRRDAIRSQQRRIAEISSSADQKLHQNQEGSGRAGWRRSTAFSRCFRIRCRRRR
ncbi:MAG: hypothetical protein U0703_02210 [Anaerolineae bacterium]